MTAWPTGWLPYEDVHGKDHTVSGTVLVWKKLESKELDRARDISVYLPPSLANALSGGRDPDRRYPVLYFMDGQNAFDDRTSYVGEWQADETLEDLARDGLEAIAVAIPNGHEARMDEYDPWRGRNAFTKGRVSGGKGDAYLEWLVGSVKDLVDRSFPTRTEREATGIVGSSLGGLISLYALIGQPKVFGMAVSMSPAVRWHDFTLLRLIEEGRMPKSRIHIDMGTHEWSGAVEDLRQLRDVLIGCGWQEGRDLQYVEERNAWHRESAWARRLPDALRFVMRDLRGS